MYSIFSTPCWWWVIPIPQAKITFCAAMYWSATFLICCWEIPVVCSIVCQSVFSISCLKRSNWSVCCAIKSVCSPRFSNTDLAIPLSRAISLPIAGCRYSLAIQVPPVIMDLALLGTAKRTSPGSLAGLIITTRPPRSRTPLSWWIKRGWLDAGLAPITNTISQCERSSSSTVDVPVPMVAPKASLVAWWQ